MKTILAPIDFSGVSDAVVAAAAQLARAFHGKVVLFSAIPPPDIPMEYSPIIADLPEIVMAGEKNAARDLARFVAKLEADFVSTETLQLTGAPIPLIVEQAEKLDADYIVMGSHGHTALYDLLVGSTTHGVLLRAKCPVIIVPAAKPAVKERKAKQERHAVA